MDYRLLMDTAILAGEIMLKNGAETYRVEETVTRMLEVCNCRHTQVVAMTTSIIATISNPDMDPLTVTRRITTRGTNLNKIYLVNQVSRDFCSGIISLEEAFHSLKDADKTVQYRDSLKNIITVVIVPLFIVIYGGDIVDASIGIVCGIILVVIIRLCDITSLNAFMRDVVTSMAVAAFASFASGHMSGINMEIIIISSIMPMVPGVAITNAVRDTLQGDYMSGGARTLEAFVKAVAIAIGVYAGLWI